ncbi:hypothetical protein HJG60_009484 [Phyllostomus discolor]|uniref:Uncharacterized protein n=1 Tax=Phyllostomus discolor TaxID=89673 RepID=A0A834DCT8_9CHIR|nr:hypothetical protein HJG60_009484 [Phyllostomus discolor]
MTEQGSHLILEPYRRRCRCLLWRTLPDARLASGGGIGLGPVQSVGTVRRLRKREHTSGRALPCWRAAAPTGRDRWAAATGKTEASLALASPSSAKTGPALAPRTGWCVLQCGHQRRRGGQGRGGRSEPALVALGQSQGWGAAAPLWPLKTILWVRLPGLLTDCLPSKARGRRTSLRHQLLLIPSPQAQAGRWGALR